MLLVQPQGSTCIGSPNQNVPRREGAGRGQGLRDDAHGCPEVGGQPVHLQLPPLRRDAAGRPARQLSVSAR